MMKGTGGPGGRIVISLPVSAFNDLHNESDRLERSLSWIMQKAWKIARKEIMTGASGKIGTDGRIIPEDICGLPLPSGKTCQQVDGHVPDDCDEDNQFLDLDKWRYLLNESNT